MFRHLLAYADEQLKEAKKDEKQLKKTIKEAMVAMGVADPKTEDEYNPRLPTSNVVTFPKAQRFKELEKQQVTFTSTANLAESAVSTVESVGASFSKSQRFSEKKVAKQTPLYPKFDLVKKTACAPTIRGLSSRQKKQMTMSKVSMSTAAEDEQIRSLGPGAYMTMQEPIAKKQVVFPKAKRFQQQKPVCTGIPLYPKDDLTKNRPKTMAMLKKQTAPNPKLQAKLKEDQDRLRLKLLYWKAVPLQFDRLFKSSIGPVLRQKYFEVSKMKGVQRRCAMQMLLDRINYLRGGFDKDISKELDGSCPAVMRKSTPKPFKMPEFTPGPDEYYPRDDMIKPRAIVFGFSKAIDNAFVEEDKRDYDINQGYFKNITNVIINPEHKPARLTEQQLLSLKRGPGFYDALFNLVQARPDKGVTKIPQVTQQNDRVNNLHQKKDVNDGIYYPSYGQIDKNVGVPLMKQQCDVKPANLPDKYLFPEHWQFYDGNLNAVRAELAKNVLVAGGMSYEQYKQHAQKVKEFKEYQERQRQVAEVGQYTPEYKQIDPNVAVPNFQKMQEKDIYPIVKEEGEVDGDNLILQPEKPKNNIIGAVEFGKMLPREQQQETDEPKEGGVLILKPEMPKTKLPDIKFDKMVGRQEEPADNEDGMDGNRLILNPQYPDPHIPSIDIKKVSERPNILGEKPGDEQQEKEALILNPTYTQIDKKVKGFVDMQRHSQVRLVPILRKKAQEDNN